MSKILVEVNVDDKTGAVGYVVVYNDPEVIRQLIEKGDEVCNRYALLDEPFTDQGENGSIVRFRKAARQATEHTQILPEYATNGEYVYRLTDDLAPVQISLREDQ